MNGQIDRQTETDGRTDGQTDRQTERGKNKKTDRDICERTPDIEFERYRHIVSLLGDVTSPTTVALYVSMTPVYVLL